MNRRDFLAVLLSAPMAAIGANRKEPDDQPPVLDWKEFSEMFDELVVKNKTHELVFMQLPAWGQSGNWLHGCKFN